MNPRLSAILILTAILCLKCGHRQIVLDRVSDLPENFLEAYRFGMNLRSVSELKEFILVTGRIDTTSESPPLRLAVIAVDHQKIFLRLSKTKINNDKTTERYSGNGYVLNLSYIEKRIENHSPIYEGYFVIEQDNNKSQYEVVGMAGSY